MTGVVKSLIFSLIIGISCKEYYETLLQRRKFKYTWLNDTIILAVMIGFMIIALTPIPPYFLQPLRVIAVFWIVVQIYFQVQALVNLVLTLFFSSLIWALSSLTTVILTALAVDGELLTDIADPIWCGLLLCLTLMFAYSYKGRTDSLHGIKWLRVGVFPILSICASMIVSMVGWYGNIFGENTQRFLLLGVGMVNLLSFYFIGNILMKEARMQDLQMMHEHMEYQMAAYQSMEQNYQQQKSFMHDYKNQLNCIQGLLAQNEVQETLDYIEKLNGKIRKSTDYVDTNHKVVNVVLNQKYQYAQEHGITMVIVVNDLSQLKISDEDLVALLVNLIDNAIEACMQLKENRIIQFKMVQENESLILSIRNPLAKPVIIKGKSIISSKKDRLDHGVGLRNVDAVIEKQGGTSALQCSQGWFCFAAMIPCKNDN